MVQQDLSRRPRSLPHLLLFLPLSRHHLVNDWLWVSLVQHLGRHPPSPGSPSFLAGGHHQLHVARQEGIGHCHVFAAVWKLKLWSISKLVDEGGRVVPHAAVESCRMLSELPKYFLHLKGSKDIFYEDASLDGSSWQSKLLLTPDEDAIPKCCLSAPLQLGEVKEGTTAFGMESCCHMIH